MSMVSPDYFVEQYKNCKYEELLPIRNELIEDIKAFERESDSQEGIKICPSPDVIYQCNLDYLAELLKLIAVKYREEKAWVEEE